MRKFHILLSVFFLLSLLPHPGWHAVTVAGAAESGGQVFSASAVPQEQGRKVVRLAYLIFDGYQTGGTPDEPKQGFGYDYYRKLAYYTGWQYEYVYGSFSELLKKLEDGEVDMMGNLSITPARAEKILFSTEEMGRESFYLYIRGENTEKYANGMADFSGKRYGYPQKSFQGELLKDWIAKNGIADATFVEDSSLQERWNNMASGKIDIAVSTLLNKRNKNNLDWVSVLKLGDAPFYIGINRRRPDLLAELNEAQRRILTVNPDFNHNNYSKYVYGVPASGTILLRSEEEWLREHPQIKVGYLKNCSPYVTYDPKTARMEGMLQIVLEKLKKHYSLDAIAVPYARAEDLMQDVRKGKMDLAFPAYGNHWLAERSDISLSDKLDTSPMLLVYSGNHREGLTGRIAVSPDNYFGAAYVQTHLRHAREVHCQSLEDAVRAVMQGEADSLIMQSHTYLAAYRQLPTLRRMNTLTLKATMDVCIGMSTRPALMGIVDKCLTFISEKEMVAMLTAADEIPVQYTWEEKISRNIGPIMLGMLFLLMAIAGAFLWRYRVAAYTEKVLREAKDNAEAMLAKEQQLTRELLEARRQAEHDAMTGLLNKGAFEVLQKVYSSDNIAMLILDIDSFKNFNDTYGHSVGDEVIKFTALTIREAFGSSDYVARIGGDEFAVIMTGVTLKQKEFVARKMKRIQAQLRSHPSLPCITLSIGIAFSDAAGKKDAKELFYNADVALYRVKEKGKDGFAFFE